MYYFLSTFYGPGMVLRTLLIIEFLANYKANPPEWFNWDFTPVLSDPGVHAFNTYTDISQGRHVCVIENPPGVGGVKYYTGEIIHFNGYVFA